MATAEQSELLDTFEAFFREYYHDEIGRLAQKYPTDQRSLFVDWTDLYRYDPDLAQDYLTEPDQLQDAAEEALRVYDLPIDVDFERAHVRVQNLSETTAIRAIRADDVNTLVSIHGIVRKATDVRPKVRTATFRCQRCESLTEVPQTGSQFQDPHECRNCGRQGPFRLAEEHSEFIDAQRLRIQESPEGLRGGETPQSVDVNIEDDLTGQVSPGDRVRVTGILRLDQESNADSPVFDIYMDGVSVELEEEEFEDMDITDEDEQAIIELSNEPDIYDRMVESIAPSIHGYEREKLAIALQLFSGVTKDLPDGSRIRGDLHILLIGDPGTGKSQLLQYIRNIAPRSVYTSGKGSSSAGLTAAAVRDDFGDGQQWTLEAGALVLADQGVAAIDELDKMRCVTGDTLVHFDDRVARIRDIAHEAAADGTIETLPNGRTIRDLDLRVWTLTDDGQLVTRPVTAIHEYNAPDQLTRVTLQTGDSVTTTPDHPFVVRSDNGRSERAAADLAPGDSVSVPQTDALTADGGTLSGNEQPSHAGVSTGADAPDRDVTWRQVASVQTTERANHAHVYDLTVDGTHNFVANGMVVHNSEDRSAMHEALEQQSYHPDTEVQLADGRRVPIGRFVETRLADRQADVIDGVDCEILPVTDVQVQTADLTTGERWTTDVDRISRHEAPDEFVRVTFSNGHAIMVTPEHPMFAVIDGEVETLPAAAIEPGTAVPAPAGHPDSTTPAVLGDGGVPAHRSRGPDHEADIFDDQPGLRTRTVTDVEPIPNEGDDATDWVYDLTVEPTNTFVSQGVVLHNSISVSKAGINATLKSRCSLLGAANPKYGRFDQYESIGEQIDLEPALISRFDLIFTVTDQPDPDEDRALAQHILTTNYAGELNTQREQMIAPDVSEDDIAAITEDVEPTIDPELLRKYVAYAKQTCHPRLTDGAQAAIEEFYVDLRSKGTDEDDPVPVTARKLEALIRLAEASARVRLSDRVTRGDAERVIEIVRSSLQNIGVDPETGQYDADVVETGTSKSQRERIKSLTSLIEDLEPEYEGGVPVEAIVDRAEDAGIDATKVEEEIEKLMQKGQVYEPQTGHLLTT